MGSIDQAVQPPTGAVDDGLTLDIAFLEGSSEGAMVNLTDNGCGSTCSSPCTTNMG